MAFKLQTPGNNPKANKRHVFCYVNPLNAQLNPICHLLALLGTHHILHVSRIRVNDQRVRMNVVMALVFWLCSFCAS
jgi:hypothetical protein